MADGNAHYAIIDDKHRMEETPLGDRWTARNTYEFLSQTADAYPDRPAISFQIKSGPRDKAETLTWRGFHREVTKTANMLRALGVGPQDVVAYILPNCNEAAISLMAGQAVGIVAPINPLMEPGQIGAILRETGAKVVVTLTPFPKTDVAAKAAAAVAEAPDVTHILEVDLKRYLSPPLSWIVPLIRPKPTGGHHAKVLNFNAEKDRHSGDKLAFDLTAGPETLGAFLHTGGTTGMPKIAQHEHQGIIYNGWLSGHLLFGPEDVLICPLPLFHVFGAHVVLMAAIASGAHMVMPTPAGYRGEGVMDNFWGLIERWGGTFMIMVPTAASALMQRPLNADVSTLKYALCGSAPLPPELFKRFESATGVTILEGYGQTEATCLISCNPPQGERKIGSVGLPFPYTDVKILHCAPDGSITRECVMDEIGEICLQSPGVFPGYREADRNVGLMAGGDWLRTGDLGRLDADGYLWITGRAKDLIIRGGHNIDPAMIEDAASAHPAVAFAGSIGQPDAHSGELPCLYVELVEGAETTPDEIREFVNGRVTERAARPTYVEIMDELPKTAVGKIFKPDLRKSAIARVYTAALSEAGAEASVTVIEDKKKGLVAVVSGATEEECGAVLDNFARPWRLAG